MSPELLILLKKIRTQLEIDLDDLQIMLNRKRKDYIGIHATILQLEGNLDDLEVEHTRVDLLQDFLDSEKENE